jgi:TM2 domain-containing membrane protein YozV
MTFRLIFTVCISCFIALTNIATASNCDSIAFHECAVDGHSDSITCFENELSIALPSPIHNLESTDPITVLKDSTTTKIDLHQKKINRRKKIITAIFAFPLPFGFVGAHRVLLGCKPWVPVVYIATFGGCFGILPLIDFCAIISTRNLVKYENNENVFMLLKD